MPGDATSTHRSNRVHTAKQLGVWGTKRSLKNHIQCVGEEGGDFTSPSLFRDDKNCLTLWDVLNLP